MQSRLNGHGRDFSQIQFYYFYFLQCFRNAVEFHARYRTRNSLAHVILFFLHTCSFNLPVLNLFQAKLFMF